MTGNGVPRDPGSLDPDLPLIIIADDDPSIRLMLHHIVVKEHYQALEASDGREAQKLVELHNPDLVLMDAIMPEQDGFVTCNILKQKFPDLPIIMITSLDDDPSVEQAFKFGADDFVTKPINWSVLKHRIGRTLQFHHSSRHPPGHTLEQQIDQQQYELRFQPRINLDDQRIMSLEARFTNTGGKHGPLFDPDSKDPLSLKAIKNLVVGACLNFKQLRDGGVDAEKLVLPVLPFMDNPQQYSDMIRQVVPDTGIDIRMLEFTISENQLQDTVIRQLYNTISDLPVNIIISQFSFSVHSLNYILKNRCNSIELNIPMILNALNASPDDSVSIETFQQMLAPYVKQQMRIIGANIEHAEEIQLAEQLGCTEAYGAALKPLIST